MNKKKLLRSTIIGFVLLLLALLVTGLFGISEGMNGGVGFLNANEYTYGLKATIGYFFQPWSVAHATGYIECVLVFMAALAVIALIILSIAKKKPAYIIPTLLLGASVAYLPFILLLVVPMVEMGVISMVAVFMMAVVAGLTLFAIYFFGLAVGDLIKEMLGALKKAGGDEFQEQRSDANGGLNEKQVRAIVEKYLAELYDENEEEEQEEGLNEEQIREIVNKCLQEHVDELHNGEPVPAVAAVVEEEQEEEPEEEAEEEEEEAEEEGEEEGEEEVAAPEDPNAPAGIAAKGKRRRASFETRLKNSEFDLRHKYYDLRDYIKWYGLRNRISIPGDTFSYKRQRYVFVTIVGKHIRVYLNLDPADYADSAIPVEKAEAKKYEDLPCLLRVKSDLAYRRAKKLVDDLMQKIGIPQPDEDKPKETQEK